MSGNAGPLTLEGEEKTAMDIKGLEEGQYTFKLTVTDETGQFDTDEVTLTVKGVTIDLILSSTSYIGRFL